MRLDALHIAVWFMNKLLIKCTCKRHTFRAQPPKGLRPSLSVYLYIFHRLGFI